MKKTYPKSNYKITKAFLFCFKIYQADGNKYHTDFYTSKGALKMWGILEDDNETFSCLKAIDDHHLEEVNYKQNIS